MQEFYQAMNDTLGMLTAFPGDRYYADVPLSSVATAISLGECSLIAALASACP